MIKATINYEGKEKDLFLFLILREHGARCISIGVTVNETLELAKKNEHRITNHHFQQVAGIENEYLFNGGEKVYKTVEKKDKKGKVTVSQVEVENPLKSVVEKVVTGNNSRDLSHNLLIGKLAENKLIIKTEKVL